MASHRSLLLFLSISLVLSASAQSFLLADSILPRLQSSRSLVLADADAELGSNSIYNDLLLGLVRAEYIDRETRTNSLEAITGEGQIGLSQVYDLRLVLKDSLFKHPHWRSQLLLGHRDIFGATYNKELFEMTFFGNKPFENSTVDLAPAGFEHYKYQKFGWGIIDSRTWSSLSISLVKGQQMQDLELDKAEVFTATDGRLIETDINGSYQFSDSADNSFTAFNGIGAALDLEFNRPVKLLNKGWLSISLRDLGIVAWNENTLSLEHDSIVSYDGITVDNIFDLDNVVLGEDVIYDSLGVSTEKGSLLKALPFLAQVSLSGSLNSRITAEVRLRYRYIHAYQPRASLHGYYKIKEHMRVGVELAYGGFNGFRAGASFDALLGDRFLLGLAVPNLPGPLSLKSHGAAGKLRFGLLF